jgi:hypothetical protein
MQKVSQRPFLRLPSRRAPTIPNEVLRASLLLQAAAGRHYILDRGPVSTELIDGAIVPDLEFNL